MDLLGYHFAQLVVSKIKSFGLIPLFNGVRVGEGPSILGMGGGRTKILG